MSPYQIGTNYPTQSPDFDDDASIEEAFYLYHYGVNEETPVSIPLNSIEGRLENFDGRITAVASSVSTSAPYLKKTTVSGENIVEPQSANVVPLVVSGEIDLQEWQEPSGAKIVRMYDDGSIEIKGYLSNTGTSIVSTAQRIDIKDAADKGIVVKGHPTQTQNLQEWSNSSGQVLGYVDSNGNVGQPATLIQKNESFEINESQHNKKTILADSSSNIVISCPDSASIGTSVEIIRMGAGEVSFTSPTGSIYSESNKNAIAVTYSGVSITKIDSTVWFLQGSLKTL